MDHKMSAENILRVIDTLKGMDVRGYDSMSRLVGLVMFFENILTEPVEEPEAEE